MSYTILVKENSRNDIGILLPYYLHRPIKYPLSHPIAFRSELLTQFCMYVCIRGGPEIRPLHRDLQWSINTILLNWSIQTYGMCMFWKGNKLSKSSQTKSLTKLHINILSILKEWTWHTETKDWWIIFDPLHNLHSCNMLKLDKLLLM
jgi:hypothetical protein